LVLVYNPACLCGVHFLFNIASPNPLIRHYEEIIADLFCILFYLAGFTQDATFQAVGVDSLRIVDLNLYFTIHVDSTFENQMISHSLACDAYQSSTEFSKFH
jgi:hypothetical protein